MPDFKNGLTVTITDHDGEVYGSYDFGQHEARHLLVQIDHENQYAKDLDINCQDEIDSEDCQRQRDVEDCLSDIWKAARACIEANPV